MSPRIVITLQRVLHPASSMYSTVKWLIIEYVLFICNHKSVLFVSPLLRSTFPFGSPGHPDTCPGPRACCGAAARRSPVAWGRPVEGRTLSGPVDPDASGPRQQKWGKWAVSHVCVIVSAAGWQTSLWGWSLHQSINQSINTSFHLSFSLTPSLHLSC